MKRVWNCIAAVMILIGLLSCAGALYGGSLLSGANMTGAQWQELLDSRATSEDKVSKMVSALHSNLDKWGETDEEWVRNSEALSQAADAALADIEAGLGDEKWNEAYEVWKAAVAQLNEQKDSSSDALRKSVKGINRQIKTTAEAFTSWEELNTGIDNLGFDPVHSIQAKCIESRQALLIAGLFMVVIGIFVFPTVREKLAKSRMTVGYLFVAPALVFLLLFVAYPIFYNIVLSVKDVDITNINFPEKQNYVGLANFIELFTDVDQQMLGSIKNTLVFTVSSIFFQFIIGFLLALLFRNKFRGGGFIRGAIMISWLIPVTVSGLLFKFMFGMNGGIINQFLGNFGIQPIEWLYSLDYAMVAVVVANIWIGIPFNMVLLLTGMTTIPKEVYESAEIDGARGLRRLFSITIPMIKPAIMSVLTLGFVYTFKVFDLVKVMTSGGPVNKTQLVSIFAYKLAFEKYEYSLGAAAGTVMFIILLIEGLFYIKAIKEDEVM